MLENYEKLFMKQKMMRTVFIALLPLVVLSVFFYGWRSFFLIIFNILIACLVEYICERKIYNRKKISEAAIITAMIYSMTLPPSLPFWISAIGITAGIFFGKAVFGGFGKNVFNPAVVGRAFIYVNFPVPITIYWNEFANGEKFFSGLGGFTQWLTPIIDGTSTATPLMLYRETGEITNLLNLSLGNIPGSIGETAKILIIIGGLYLLYKKVASWQIVVSQLIGFFATSFLLILAGVESVPNPIAGMLMGGFLFGAMFMSTDPISAPKTVQGKWFYGLIIGATVVIIRAFALFAGGMMFAILLGNVFSPIIDYVAKKRNALRKQREANLVKAVE